MPPLSIAEGKAMYPSMGVNLSTLITVVFRQLDSTGLSMSEKGGDSDLIMYLNVLMNI